MTKSRKGTWSVLGLLVILALVVSGRNVAYPGAYLKPYKRE